MVIVLKIRKISKLIEAVKFTGNNQKEIDEFIGTDGNTTLLPNQIQIHFCYGYVRTLGVGDFLVRDVHGMYDRINKDVFKKCYEVAE